ncbi:hypothetical protein DFH28DRAFT_1169111 [Melampsora americana]|nr:hypothetical protein DFH28DRAFT_1169111 [Melampsora americana]
METRRRNYTSNPRSPPKRKRKTVQRKKLPVQELTQKLDNPTSQFFPNLSLLPPLPASPVEEKSTPLEDTSATDSEVTSPGTISELAIGILNIDIESNSSEQTPGSIRNNIKMVSPIAENTSPVMSTAEQYELLEINQGNKLLMNNIKFDHLKKDGSNFVEWKKNTVRAMKASISINNYWDNEHVTDDCINAYEAMKALQKHFRQGGRTSQFSLFNQLIHLKLDLNETDMLAHMSAIDAIVSELESTGFAWTNETI